MVTTGEFLGRRVGRFTITSHLASGGMAELFIARQEAVGGFEKDLVLKMLQERYARNARVVEMFLDEARLAAKLNHQNIVHVYDVDEADGVHYIAMEYIHGETLTDIVRRSIAAGGFLPLEHAIHIVAETAAGLAYAHDSRDPEGRPARIVHRDISPSNILVTYEGLTKIVDFGIARVQDQIREESGMRPGKVSYMSPEQVRGEPADHRSDIFSLGIILYEMTVGRRLWRGPPEIVMRRIVEESIAPPTYVRRDYPPALELIVMKALERRPGERFQSAAALQHDLSEFMEESALKSGTRRLSQYMKELFAADTGTADRRRTGRQSSTGTGPNADSSVDQPGQGKADEDDGLEELDFDRRAPLMMRIEARPDVRADAIPVERSAAGSRRSPMHLGPDAGTPTPKPGGTGLPTRAPGRPEAASNFPGGALTPAPVSGAFSGRSEPFGADGADRWRAREGAIPGFRDPALRKEGSALTPVGATLADPSARSGAKPAASGSWSASGSHWTRATSTIGSSSDVPILQKPGSSGMFTGPRSSGTSSGLSPLPAQTPNPGSAAVRWAIVLLLAGALVVVFLATR